MFSWWCLIYRDTAPDKRSIHKIFLHENICYGYLLEALLMSTHYVCFHGEISKISNSIHFRWKIILAGVKVLRYIVTLFTRIKAMWKSILNHITQNYTVHISGEHMLIYRKTELLFVVNKRRRPVLSFHSIQPALVWHSPLGEQRGFFCHHENMPI